MEQVGVLAGLVALLASAPVSAAPLVVLDPGHGGVHGGAKNADGVFEKQVTLRIARHVRDALRARGVRVLMTRDGDKTMSLGARPQLARDKGAKAFVSIHNNWAPVPGRRGVETYVLSAHASDADAAALLHSEEDGELGADDGHEHASDLDAILGDLELANGHEQSGRLAKKIQQQLGKVAGLGPSRGLRQAPFRVLKGATMASVLVEVGYLSNLKQGKYLASEAGQKAAGRAIAKGICAYLKACRKAPKG